MRPGLALAAGAVLALSMAACTSAPDVRREGTLRTFEPAVPVSVPERLSLPARVGLSRIVDGQVTAIPADERARWMGAAHQVNRPLPATLHLVPMPAVGATPRGPDGQPDPGAALLRVIEIARASRFDAVLFYELSARAEWDRPVSWLGELPLFGGVIPKTAMTEGHGTAVAILIDPYTMGVHGAATARMSDRELTSVRLSRGRPSAVQDLADYALLHTLIPRAEDLLTAAATRP